MSTDPQSSLDLTAPSPGKLRGWRLGIQLPPKLTVSEWADRHRYIAKGTGPESGRWRTDRAIFQREPMDSVTEDDVEIVVLMWSSQVGKTEVLVNVAGFFIDHDPAPQLFVMPNLELADSFSRNRFGPTINASPRLLERIGEHRSRDTSTTILEKSYPGGDIVFAGANSPSSLASRPRRVVLFDEVDKFRSNIGNDGDPIKQGFQRTQNFWNAKRVLASTPTLAGMSLIEDWFARSDQRFFEVPCPLCGTHQALEWQSDETDATGGTIKHDRVRWPRGKPEAAEYVCAECGGVWSEGDRHRAVRAGRWRARRPEIRRVRGYHLSALYSPWVSLAELAREWEDCAGKPAEEQTFFNLKLGRTYNPTKEAATTAAELFGRREDYGPTNVPPDVSAVTAFVDVQANRLEVQYIGWGAGDEKWVLDYAITYGDPTDPALWSRLDADYLSRAFKTADGFELAIDAVGIDAGYLQQVVLDFVRERRAAFRPFYAVRGMAGHGRPLWRESEQKFKFGAKLFLSGVDDGKTQLYRELAVRPDVKSGVDRFRVHFPRHLELTYFEQLVAERVRIDFKAGRAVPSWVLPGGKRNEALDTFVGAMAVRATISLNYEQRRRSRRGDQVEVSGGDLARLFK